DGSLWCFCTDPFTSDEEALTAKLHKFVSNDDGASWQEEPIDWSDKVSGVVSAVITSPAGTSLFASYTQQESTLWCVKAGGEPEQVILPGFTPELPVAQCFFVTEDIIYLTTSPEHDGNGGVKTPAKTALFSLSTKEKIADIQPVESNFSGLEGYLFGCASDGKQLFNLTYTQTGRTLCALQPDGTVKELLTDDSPSDGGGAADADGNYYFAGSDGIFRIASGGTLVENIMDSAAFSLGLPENYVTGLCRTASGDFLVALRTQMADGDGTMQLYRYHYDETLPAPSTDGLRIWSLADNATIRAAIVAYSKAHPEIAVHYTPVWEGGDYSLNAQDALRTLNTELLSGDGPDVLILDGFDAAPYLQKGMLMDLSGAIDKAALVQNIASPYTKDDAVYLLPARFSVPVLFGDAGTVENLTTLDALQAAILAAAPRPDFNVSDSGYYDPVAEKDRFGLSFLTPGQLMEFVLQTSMPALVQENAVSEENLRAALSFVKAVSDHYGLGNYREEQEFNGIASSYSNSDAVSLGDGGVEFMQTGHALYGWGTMDTTALAGNLGRYNETEKKYIGNNLVVQPGLVQGAYLPKTLLGVSASSKKQSEALDFVKIVLGETVQDSFSGDGMPVRQSSLTKMLVRNKPREKAAFAGDVTALLNTLKTPVVVDNIVKEKLEVHARALCKGEETLDAAVTGVQNDLSIYLAERK
ncbi:MAG: extracellular solute-binding protein, partial [Ruthenibacterium sp.]